MYLFRELNLKAHDIILSCKGLLFLLALFLIFSVLITTTINFFFDI